MYLSFFGFHKKPFSLTPDPSFFFPSESHRQALAHLRYGLRERVGFIALTGEVGAGKTHLVRLLLQELGPDVKRALIVNPVLGPDDLLAAIMQDLEIAFDTSCGLRNKLGIFVEYLLQEHCHGRRVLIIIDESHNLPIQSLERLRLLSNLETAGAKLVQILLVGQPELNLLLNLPPLRSLNQRITVRSHINPLGLQDSAEFIHHRLLVAGGPRIDVEFTKWAIRLIHRAAGGIPRLISALCDFCLLIAYTDEITKVTPKVAREAIRLHRSKEPISEPRRMQREYHRRALIPVISGSLALVVGLGLTGWNLYSSSEDPTPHGRNLAVSSTFLHSAVEKPSVVPDHSEITLRPDPSRYEPTQSAETEALSFLNQAPPPNENLQEGFEESSHEVIIGAPLVTPSRFEAFDGPSETELKPRGKRFGVQVASAKSMAQARGTAMEVSNLGPVYMIPTTSSDGRKWVKVVVGAFETFEEAVSLAEDLNDRGKTKDACVVNNYWWNSKTQPGLSKMTVVEGRMAVGGV